MQSTFLAAVIWHFADKGRRGSTDADVRTFWRKNFGFSIFMLCPHGQGGGELLWSDILRTRE